MIGLYGPVLFGTLGGAVCTFDGFKKTVAARWGVHEIWQSKPGLEYAGASLIEIEFKMELIKPYTVDPLGTIVLLQETMDLALPYPLILGMLPVGRGLSLFVLTDLSVEFKYFFKGGGILGATVDVKLKEYPNPNIINTLLQALGGGSPSSSAAPSTDSATTTPTGDVQVGQLQQINPDATTTTPTEVTAPETVNNSISNQNQGPELVGQPDSPVGGNLQDSAGPSPTPQVPQTGGEASGGTHTLVPILGGQPAPTPFVPSGHN